MQGPPFNMSNPYVGDVRVRKPVVPVVQDESLRSVPRPTISEAQMEQQDLQMGKETLQRTLEDRPGTVIEMKEKPTPPKKRGPLESVFWVLATGLILFYGNGKQHFVEVALTDPHVIRRPIFVGSICLVVDAAIFLYLAIFVRLIQRDPRHFDLAAPGVLSAASLLGVFSFVLFSIALWPVFGIFIVPMLWCFFMGFLVLASFTPSLKEPNPKYLRMMGKQD